MKKDWGLLVALFGLVIYTFIAYSIFKDFNGFGNIFSILKFVIGLIATIAVLYFIQRILGGGSKWTMLV